VIQAQSPSSNVRHLLTRCKKRQISSVSRTIEIEAAAALAAQIALPESSNRIHHYAFDQNAIALYTNTLFLLVEEVLS